MSIILLEPEDLKEWRVLVKNNRSAGRLISIPKYFIEKAGFDAEKDKVEGRWTCWQTQGKILVLELRDATNSVSKDEGGEVFKSTEEV